MDFDLNFFKAIAEIKKKHGKPTEDVRSVMECPTCKGDLRYFVSSHNGHTHGSCDTKGCLKWME
jgi:ssDNA-binding Zn-finger/Zn-ribbon topoisomerase 1